MTVRPGQPFQFTNAALQLGSAAGPTQTLTNSAWAIVYSMYFLFTASATVGNRQLVFRLSYPSGGPIIWHNVASAVITAGQAVNIEIGAGLTNQSFTTPLTQIIGLPVECCVPVAAQLNVFDANNVSVTDTLTTVVVTFAM